MNRFKKICGSLVLAASLVAGLAATNPTPAVAAASDAELTELAKVIDAAKKATTEIATTNTTVSDSTANISISFSGLPIASIPVTLTTTVDPKSHNASLKGTATLPDLSAASSLAPDLGTILSNLYLKAGEKPIEAYGDLQKNTIYRYNSNVGRSEVADLPVSLVSGSVLDSLDATAFASLAPYITITKGKTDLTLNLKADEAGVKSKLKEINTLLKGFTAGFEDNPTVRSVMTKLMKKITIKGIDVTVKFVLDSTNGALKQHDIDAKIDVAFSGAPLTIALTNSTKSSVSTDTVAIPEAFTKGAQLIANYPVVKGGVTFLSTLSGKKTVFSVSSVKNAKSLTIPASITKFGTKYSVSKAAKNAFKKATKLKTLTIKNSTLKKAVKKNRSKYGVKKGVKIK